MLAISCLRQTSRRWVLSTSRSTLSSGPSPKVNDKPAGSNVTSSNYPGFYDTANADRLQFEDRHRSASKTNNAEPVALNDVLELKRVQEGASNQHASIPVVTSKEKFIAGLAPIQGTSSITPTSSGLLQDAHVSNTMVSPGIPVVPLPPSPISEQQTRKEEQIPSSRFTAFLRSIRSGLPFFPSTKPSPSTLDIATTREYFIPLTRPSLIRMIATDSHLMQDVEDRHLFHQLCQGFDSAVMQHYHAVLNELKHLFNPLNPDDETLDNRRVAYRDRLDNEYWLLQKIDDLLRRANFTELPRHMMLDKYLLHEDSLSSSNLQVRIDGYNYDVLKFWILGREQMPKDNKPWWKRILQRKTLATSTDYFKRVIVAARLKGQDRLYLKAFRDIPLQNLTQLLPVGKLQIGNFEQQLIWFTMGLGGTTAATYLITTMANYPLPGLLLGGSSLTILLGLWSMRSFYRSKINYLSGMNRSLFYKNVASNKQLLAMITDRAQDELSKEVLLAYMLILDQQRDGGELTAKNLELKIENWIRARTNTPVTFKSDQSIEFLRKLGILLHDDPTRPGCLKVVPLKQVVGILPKMSRTLSEKDEGWDLLEGYDRKYFELDWKTVLHEDQLLNKGGWN